MRADRRGVRVHARVCSAGAANRAGRRRGLADPHDADHCDKSLTGLGRRVHARSSASDKLQPAAAYDPFIAVLARDATDARAAVQLVLAQSSISSQMVDNLNASIHLRALLTDLFLIDEIVRPEAAERALRQRTD